MGIFILVIDQILFSLLIPWLILSPSLSRNNYTEPQQIIIDTYYVPGPIPRTEEQDTFSAFLVLFNRRRL